MSRSYASLSAEMGQVVLFCCMTHILAPISLRRSYGEYGVNTAVSRISLSAPCIETEAAAPGKMERYSYSAIGTISVASLMLGLSPFKSW